MSKYWDSTPPVHVSLNRLCSAFLKPTGTKPAQKQIEGSITEGRGTLQNLMEEFGMAGGSVA